MAAKKNPWFRFYPSDWLGDPGLKACDAGAQALWIHMICLMHEAEPYGHLVTRTGEPMPVETLCRTFNQHGNRVRFYLRNLLENGVYSVTKEGVIFSRKMVADHAKSLKKQQAGKKGGNPVLKHEDKPIETRSQKPEPESKKEEIAYGFVGNVIKLNQKDFVQWSNAYQALDLLAELVARDAWLSTQAPSAQKQWFVSTSQYLANRNRDAKVKVAAGSWGPGGII